MSTLDWFGLTLAFLAPIPARRPEPPEKPRGRRGGDWAAPVIIGSVCLVMVLPMVAVWSFHRPLEPQRRRCAAAGGHLLPASLDGGGPYRCAADGHGLPTR